MEKHSIPTVFIQRNKKPPGWCEENGIEHAWEGGPTLTVNPPIQTRICINCGKEQRKHPAEWV